MTKKKQAALAPVQAEEQSTISRFDQLAETLPDGLRREAVFAVRDFRSSWVKLGRLLTDVAYGGDYKDWGFADFELYCFHELGLKKPMVKKLMISYSYLKKHEPDRLRLALADSADVPDYQTVEMLHRATSAAGEDNPEVREYHARAFAGEDDEGALRKGIRGVLMQQDLHAEDGRTAERMKKAAELVRHLRAARKLAAEASVPESMRERLEQIALEFETLD